MLAGISQTYYVFLEQGRGVRPSRQVVEALAHALRLSPTEHVLLNELARGDGTANVLHLAEEIDPTLASLVQRLDPEPAYVTGRRWDVLAANRAARLLWTNWDALAPEARNMVWWVFSDPAARSVFVEWDKEAVTLLGRFRAAAARHADDPGFGDLIERLRRISVEFRTWWPRFEVAPLTSGVKHLRHPDLGEIRMRFVVLQVADNVDQKLVTFQLSDEDRPRVAALLATMVRNPKELPSTSASPRRRMPTRRRRAAARP